MVVTLRKNRGLLLTLRAALLLSLGAGAASADEVPSRPAAPPTPRRAALTARVQEHNGLHSVYLGGPQPSYLIDPRTETCALVAPNGSLLAVDCAKLARSLPMVRDVITWSNGAPPPAPQSAAPPSAPPISDQELDQGIRCQDNLCTIDRGLFDKLLADGNQLASGGRMVPATKDGVVSGIKIFGIRPGSVFARLGLQNGDLIKTINGLDISTPDKALDAYTRLRSSSALLLELERRGKNLTLNLQLR